MLWRAVRPQREGHEWRHDLEGFQLPCQTRESTTHRSQRRTAGEQAVLGFRRSTKMCSDPQQGLDVYRTLSFALFLFSFALSDRTGETI